MTNAQIDPLRQNARRSSAVPILWILLALLIFSAAVRAWLSAKILFQDDDLRILWRWQDLDFPGWLAILILAAADQAHTGATRKLVPWILAAGTLVAAITNFIWDFRGTMELAAATLLALAAAIIGLRQISQVTLKQGTTAGQGGGGVTIDELWRLLAVQWMLVWVAAEVFLRWRFRHVAMLDEGARRLLFGLAAFGFLPNVLLSVGLTWWSAIAARANPSNHAHPARPRAWVVSLIAFNLGAMGLVASSMGIRFVGTLGFLTALAALALYFLGFGKSAWKKAGGGGVPAAWIAFAIATLLFLLEPMSGASLTAQLQFRTAWRLLIGYGVPLLWLSGFASLAARAYVPERLRAPEASKMAKLLILLGIAASTLTLAAGPSWLDATSSGALLLLAGLLIAAAIVARGGGGLRSARL